MDANYPRNTRIQPTVTDPNPRRTAPKVPGLNAQPLGPSIGTDHWRTHPTKLGKPHPKSKARGNHQVRPIAGRANPENARPTPVKPAKPTKGTGRSARAARARQAKRAIA